MSGHARSRARARLAAGLAVVVLALAGAPGAGSQGPVQHGAQPNPQEVRPGSPDGDSPSATAGELVRGEETRRVLGLPVNAVLVIAGVLLALLGLAGVLIPRTRREARGRGNGTDGSREPREKIGGQDP
jgi:hypothetical protein